MRIIETHKIPSIRYIVFCLTYLHVSNSALYFAEYYCTPFSIDVVLTLSINIVCADDLMRPKSEYLTKIAVVDKCVSF